MPQIGGIVNLKLIIIYSFDDSFRIRFRNRIQEKMQNRPKNRNRNRKGIGFDTALEEKKRGGIELRGF